MRNFMTNQMMPDRASQPASDHDWPLSIRLRRRAEGCLHERGGVRTHIRVKGGVRKSVPDTSHHLFFRQFQLNIIEPYISILRSATSNEDFVGVPAFKNDP